MKNVCAPCLYTLDNEEPLHPAMLVAIDGNQSLKLVDDMFRYGEALPDERDGRSDIWLTAEDVDRFKDEVQSARQVRFFIRFKSLYSAHSPGYSPYTLSRERPY